MRTILHNMVKFLTIMVMMSIPFNAVAQNANASAGANSVYIEQVGSSNVITLNQAGGTNSIGGTSSASAGVWDPASSTNYATITGSTNAVTMTQTGNSTIGQYNIRGNNNVYTSTVIGNSNKTKLDIGTSSAASNLRNTVVETVTGDSNTLVTKVVGNDIISTTTVTGHTNEITSSLLSSNADSTITIVGGNNKLTIEQKDTAGALGHSLIQNMVGDYNSIVTQQQGFNDTTVNVQTTGGHNTITVRTSSAAITTPLTAVAR